MTGRAGSRGGALTAACQGCRGGGARWMMLVPHPAGGRWGVRQEVAGAQRGGGRGPKEGASRARGHRPRRVRRPGGPGKLVLMLQCHEKHSITAAPGAAHACSACCSALGRAWKWCYHMPLPWRIPLNGTVALESLCISHRHGQHLSCGAARWTGSVQHSTLLACTNSCAWLLRTACSQEVDSPCHPVRRCSTASSCR